MKNTVIGGYDSVSSYATVVERYDLLGSTHDTASRVLDSMTCMLLSMLQRTLVECKLKFCNPTAVGRVAIIGLLVAFQTSREI
jgi:hypothetical protein